MTHRLAIGLPPTAPSRWPSTRGAQRGGRRGRGLPRRLLPRPPAHAVWRTTHSRDGAHPALAAKMNPTTSKTPAYLPALAPRRRLWPWVVVARRRCSGFGRRGGHRRPCSGAGSSERSRRPLILGITAAVVAGGDRRRGWAGIRVWPGLDAKRTPPAHSSVWALQTGDGLRYARVNTAIDEKLNTVRSVANPSAVEQAGGRGLRVLGELRQAHPHR